MQKPKQFGRTPKRRRRGLTPKQLQKLAGIQLKQITPVDIEKIEKTIKQQPHSRQSHTGIQILKATLTQHQDPHTRWWAAWALGSIGPQATAAIPELRNALKDQYPAVRLHAAWALGSIGPQAITAIPELRNALKDQYPGVRERAEWALKKIEEKQKGK